MKNTLRKQIIEKREKLSEEFRKEYSEDLSYIFLNSDIYAKAKVIMSYVSFKGEFDTSIINKRILEDKKTLLLPKTYGKGHMKAYKVSNLHKLKENKFGLKEPEEGEEFEPDLIIVPGIAFDKEGNRLGFGAGYYDRFLLDTKANTLAFCYDFQIIETIPKEEHDIPVNEIYYLED